MNSHQFKLHWFEYIRQSKMDKFLLITESQNFGSRAESDLIVDEQTFQSYIKNVPI